MAEGPVYIDPWAYVSMLPLIEVHRLIVAGNIVGMYLVRCITSNLMDFVGPT